jgi:hypothetical protein
MNAPLAHSPFGGSVAARVMACPRSVPLIETVPPYLRKSSSFAERGSALHVAVPRLIERECSLDDLVGQTIGDYQLTRDDVENALRPDLVHVNALLDQPGAEYFVEHRVAFPGIDGAFGTCDLLVRVGTTIHVVDHKFGAGVKVLARYPDGSVNPQLLFYAAGARHSLPEFFVGVDTVELTILQPQSIDPDSEMVSSTTVTPADLDAFVTTYRAACAEALGPAPRLERGPHCRFCPARPICPEFTKPLLDMARFEMPVPAAQPSKEAYLQLLADGLNLVDAVKDISKALHDQAKQALDGDLVPGFALSSGRAVRTWRDEQAAIGKLIGLGLLRDDVIAEALRSPKQVELRAKVRGIAIPSEFIVSTRSGTSLVRAENAHVPGPSRAELVRTFTSALEALKKGAK